MKRLRFMTVSCMRADFAARSTKRSHEGADTKKTPSTNAKHHQTIRINQSEDPLTEKTK